ncbi:hypothetical protein SAMN05444365_10183 [Micromonospora pattaloongensis]|uniref:Uncharacterized protein n=1 Tax=Micromonospora pattaloongensis TaxID=405436 RepID=A0A1H3FMU9_9ACTN|nr:hypothetical protein [Micromonospora pattaloongensis]SDX92205.1 hypothetical protein SAMN05444365_10183 [Micromonospora pattaloongensis]
MPEQNQRRGAEPVTGIAPERDEPPYYEPPGPPTTFGATTVGGAAAAAALAGPRRPVRLDPRDEDTVADGDGPVDEDLPAVDPRHAVARHRRDR